MRSYIKIGFFALMMLVGKASLSQTSSVQQTALERAKTDSLTKVNYRETLQSLGLELPVLPSMEDDPNRPPNSVRRSNGNGYTDAQGRSLIRSPWGAWVNYDEDKANQYVLPDPLLLKNGKPVTSAKIWWKLRRPEIVDDYETEVFGRVPKNAPDVTFEVGSIDSAFLDGNAVKKIITGHIDNSAYPEAKPQINLVLYLPVKSTGPVPLMVVASSDTKGNDAIIKLLISNGWAIAYFDTKALQADNGAGLSQGVIGLVNRGKSRRSDDWGVLRAWAWGLSRALDYFEKDKAINPHQIGIEGHSRWGKTALLAGAMDTRWAIVFASCSGSGGASLEKRNFGENLGLIAAENEYHWMAPAFLKYGGNWEAMPVDAHDMIALVAPRPLFITGGTQDIWADPLGEFKACLVATPVYTLLGKTGITEVQLPAPDVALINGDLSFREHTGGHTDILDWPVFIEFAKKYFK